MDFVSDGLAYGRRFRCLNIVDDYTRECLAIEVDISLPGLRVAQVLQRLAELRGLPKSITVDNGPEFAGRVLDAWAYQVGVKLPFIRPGKPGLSVILCAGHIMRTKDHGYADEEETHSSRSGGGPWAAA